MISWLKHILINRANPISDSNQPESDQLEHDPMTDTPPLITADVNLAIDKIIYQLKFIAESYALKLFNSTTQQQNTSHDLKLMLQHRDLNRVRLELLDTEQTIIFTFEVSFAEQRVESGLADHAGGIEVPLLNQYTVASHRLVITFGTGPQELDYRRWFKCRWSSADRLPCKTDQQYASAHAHRITGGRQEAKFRVGNGFRHRLKVVRCGPRYAFGEAEAFQSAPVFIPLDQLPSGCKLTQGTQISAVIVQSPRGLQARCIQL